MNESASPLALPNPDIWRKRLPSLVWLVPVVAAAIGLWLVVHAWLEQGPTITVRFTSGEGIEAGKTRIRYKDVEVGDVRRIVISPDRKAVIVTAQLGKEARDLLTQDAKFFIVRPRISGGTVSGLGTLLSGAYIAVEPGAAEKLSTDFTGLEVPLVVRDGMPGREFVLHAVELGSLDYGTPVFYRRVVVGRVTRYAIQHDGGGIDIAVFIDAPYDKFVTENTRFWHASGVDISIDATGLKVSTESLASIIEGGVAFEDLPNPSPAVDPASSGNSYALYSNRAEAMKQLDRHRQLFSIYFPESLRGLSVGAPVDFRGIVIGEVKSLGVEYEKGFNQIRFPVEVNVYPDRLWSRVRDGAPVDANGEAHSKAVIDGLVAHGMRAQLRSASLLTGQLYIALDFFPDAAEASVKWSHTPPVVPSLPGGLGEIQDTVGRIAKKIDRIPIERLSEELSGALISLDGTLKVGHKLIGHIDSEVAPQAARTFAEAERALKEANAVLAGGTPVERDVQEALRQVALSARSVEQLADYLERHPESLIRGKPEDAR